MLSMNLRGNLWKYLIITRRFLRNRSQSSTILDDYATIYRPEVESELEHLAVQTTRNKSLQINYEIEQQEKRRETIRYHIIRRKYVAHPKDIQINPYVKNHMQFLYKNYSKRWNVQMLAESFNQSVENVRLILQQRNRRGMKVRARLPSSLFGVNDEEQAEKILREHLIKRDLISTKKSTLSNDDDNVEPVDHQILAEESHLIPRQRPSDEYLKRDNDGFFSNIIENENHEQFRLSSPETLLDRINKLRVNSNVTYESTNSDLSETRLKILDRMQRTNDSLADMIERKEKFMKKPSIKK